jgi:hypothetical protein
MSSGSSSPGIELDASHGDSERDFDDGSDAEDAGSEYSGSESESEQPQADRTFDPMPAHLTLPLELQSRILFLQDSQLQSVWGTYRFGAYAFFSSFFRARLSIIMPVCRAWKEYIEHLAKTRWVRTGAFLYAGYMTVHHSLHVVDFHADGF